MITIFILYASLILYVRINAYAFMHLSLNDTIGEESCSKLLENFAYYTSNFTFCAINHSRPILLCETCINHYLNVLEEHDKILNLYDSSGVHCKERLINLDRFEVLEATFTYISNLWQNGNCDNCFEKSNNGTTTRELSNYTKTFKHLHSLTHTCVVNHYHEENKTYDKNVCTNCSEFYLNMNTFYYKLEDEQGRAMCMDIIDTMNTSRTCWSNKLGCNKKDSSTDALLIALILIMATFPVIFYTSVKCLNHKSESKLSQQKRLAEHITTSRGDR